MRKYRCSIKLKKIIEKKRSEGWSLLLKIFMKYYTDQSFTKARTDKNIKSYLRSCSSLSKGAKYDSTSLIIFSTYIGEETEKLFAILDNQPFNSKSVSLYILSCSCCSRNSFTNSYIWNCKHLRYFKLQLPY